MDNLLGVVIDSGPSDWQIVQQDRRGCADLPVAGRWVSDEPPAGIWIRLVREDRGTPVAAHLDWTACRMGRDGTWSGVLRRVPAGGLYRLETQLHNPRVPDFEWALRGDVRHFIGVGDVWVVAGQSNSAGYGRGPLHDPPELGVHSFTNANRWALAAHPLNDSTDTVHPVNREYSNSAHAPWLHWGKVMQRALGHPIGLVQTALGGQALSRWNPREPGDHGLFELLRSAVAAAGGRVRGVLWYQGETDGDRSATARTYARRFVQAVRAWRTALRCPGLPVLTVQINRILEACSPDKHLGWGLVREAQRQIPRLLRGVTVSPSLDLPFSDFVHTAPAGNLVLAERVAQAALGAVYGRAEAWQAPEPTAARRRGNGRVIELLVAHVTGTLRPSNRTHQPFVVEDAAGEVPVTRVEYTKNAVVRLHLARAAGARAVVHGGVGGDPPDLPVDSPRTMPMLAFYGLKVR